MNKFVCIGRFTKDAELKELQSGKKVCNFSLAIKRRFGDDTDFLDFEAWESTANFINQYFKKGDLIAIIGRVETRTWERDEKHFKSVVIVVEEAHFCGAKKDSHKSQEALSKADDDFVEVDYGDLDVPF